jgi:hypothetical protein
MRSLLLVVLLVSCSTFAAGKKKPKPATPPPDETGAVTKALDAVQDRVSNCVATTVPYDGKTLVAKVELKLNSGAQVMSLKVTLTPEPATADSTKACIEKAVRGAPFPKTVSPLVVVEREWSFKLE